MSRPPPLGGIVALMFGLVFSIAYPFERVPLLVTVMSSGYLFLFVLQVRPR